MPDQVDVIADQVDVIRDQVDVIRDRINLIADQVNPIIVESVGGTEASLGRWDDRVHRPHH